MCVLRSEDKGWYICEHKADHNHAPSVNCMEKLHWKSHRHIDRYTRDLMKQLRENNISLSKIYSVVGSFFGSVKQVPFTKRSLKTLCGKLSREQSENDATKTIEVFNAMRAEDPEFKYSVQVDDDSRVKTLMWTTGRSIEQFKCFGDAVTFDTTYKTNLYDMPFGLFVGVNNHFQSIIFGGLLMNDEKINTFKWIFTEFFQMIGAPQPRTMLTDQARAMEVAIDDVMKHTTHRWCTWHVVKKQKSVSDHCSAKEVNSNRSSTRWCTTLLVRKSLRMVGSVWLRGMVYRKIRFSPRYMRCEGSGLSHILWMSSVRR